MNYSLFCLSYLGFRFPQPLDASRTGAQHEMNVVSVDVCV
jgi:hypothetical protein